MAARSTDTNQNTTLKRRGPTIGDLPKGYASGDRLYWEQLILNNWGRFCKQNPDGSIDRTRCTDHTDEITVRIRANPGGESSSFSYNKTYFPSTGAFTETHIDAWGINSGNIIGAASEDIDGRNSNSGVPIYYSSVRGSVLTLAFALWTKNPDGVFTYEGGKTADANCNKTNNTCRY